MENWEPHLKIDSPQRKRLKKLLEGNDESMDHAYSLADLSVLRDRFLSTFQKLQTHAPVTPPRLPPAVELTRSTSEPAYKNETTGKRVSLLRATSGIREDQGLQLLEMAHLFQERLE